MRAERRFSEQSLDSLLDTLANVAGILIVLVAVTQLSVGDAVDRIREREAASSVSQAEVERAEAEGQRVQAELSRAARRWQALEQSARKTRPEQLADLLARLEAGLEPEGNAELGADAQKLSRRARDEAAHVAGLGDEADALRNRLTRLEALIDSLPLEARPKRARLPDPRPPPPDSSELAFFCRHGSIESVDLAGLLEALDRGMREAVGAEEGRFILDWNERPWIQNHFDKEPIGGAGFRWRFVDLSGSRFVVSLDWEGEANAARGETRVELQLADSQYRRVLAAHDPAERFARFYVWSDSYDVYLEARYLAENRGYAVSWVPIDADKEIGGDIIDHGGPKPRVFVD